MQCDEISLYTITIDTHCTQVAQLAQGERTMINIKINTDGAAFDNGYEATEVAAILRTIANRISGEDDINASICIVDLNGNRCGSYEVD